MSANDARGLFTGNSPRMASTESKASQSSGAVKFTSEELDHASEEDPSRIPCEYENATAANPISRSSGTSSR
jgi:hypothetical protein